MISSSSSPLTWVDLARRLSCVDLSSVDQLVGLQSVRVGYAGLVLSTYEEVSDHDAAEWLKRFFPGRVYLDPFRILLDGPVFASTLPVELETSEKTERFRQSFGIVDGMIEAKHHLYRSSDKRQIPIVPVMSIKGGTGRTTTAAAIALRWSEHAKKSILLVDADLEAPGISYLLEDVLPETKIALEDAVVLAHSELDSDSPQTIEFVAERIREQNIAGGIYVLPLRRNLSELASSAVRPEHLSTPARPFALADLLSSIGANLDCAGVVIDVRAGLMPVGVNLALDPDAFPVVVTTLSDQAIKGTRSLMNFIDREVRRSGNTPCKPLIVVNRVPTVFQQAGMDTKLIEPLLNDLTSNLLASHSGPIAPDESVFDGSEALEPYALVTVNEISDLQVSASSWDAFIEQIHSSGFSSRISETINAWLPETVTSAGGVPQTSKISAPIASIDERRVALARFSESLIAAENIQGKISKPLVTHPLSALAARFISDVPVAVVEGAKGTGKTLAARYIIDQHTWSAVVKELSGHTKAIKAYILPVCASIQVSEQYLNQVDAARRTIAAELGLFSPQITAVTTQMLRAARAASLTEEEWAVIWYDSIAWSCGFEVDQKGAGSRFVDFLRKANKSVVAVFEGLEELYDSPDDPGVFSMMRSLLVSIPQSLRSELKRPLGAILFARRDTVELAVRQNIDQYRREYLPFALTWTEGDVLELAAWLATQAHCLPELWTSNFSSLSNNVKASQLTALWGAKLGPDDSPGRRSREAYTHNWIIAVLSDLQGRLVPRDLIRLIANAAQLSADDSEKSSFRNRILLPKALKQAVEPTSFFKVRETEEEIVELKPIFEKFRERAEQVFAPLDRQSLEMLGLQPTEIDALARHGIAFGDKPPYEVPELFRRGLGLRHSGARYSVVNLYKRARQKV